MPPPSPVWAWKRGEKAREFRDSTFKMRVRIEGRWHESNSVSLKIGETKKE